MNRGGLLLIVGPDGAGKTTLRHAIVDSAPAGIRVETERRAVLPRLTVGPVTEPHRHGAYPRPLSLLKTIYYFAEALLSWFLRQRPAVRRGAWVILERGWWDLAVDPKRYRLQPHVGLFRFLGRLLPQPDLVIVLEGAPALIWSRKPELSQEEIARQSAAWRRTLPSAQRRTYHDVTRPVGELAQLVNAELQEMAEARRAPERSLYVGLPGRHSPRWILPAAPRSAAAHALRIYHPVTLRGHLGWFAARVLAGTGAFRLLPRGPRPPSSVLEALRSSAHPPAAVAVARTNHPNRYTAILLSGDAEITGFAKVATDGPSRTALERECRAMETLGPQLPSPLFAPRVLDERDGLLVLEHVEWRPRLRPWFLPEEVAFAVGAFHAATGACHGDFAPWNLLRSGRGWALVDWEAASHDAPPGRDVFHYLVQAATLLGHPSRRRLFRAFGADGWVGRALAAYAAGARLPASELPRWFESYLEDSSGRMELDKPGAAAGLAFRRRLLDELRGVRSG